MVTSLLKTLSQEETPVKLFDPNIIEFYDSISTDAADDSESKPEIQILT